MRITSADFVAMYSKHERIYMMDEGLAEVVVEGNEVYIILK